MGFHMERVILTLLSLSAIVIADDIDTGVREGAMLKFLRQMVNQTAADTLNLPANATSIRENITDTFSCENRTYGYYADVDNDCQLFHVCLPSQNPSRRNVTYRWSFICPNETMFNQEVLTCARPRDSINCEDSPMYFDLNMEIGKTEQNEQLSQNEQQPQNMDQQKPPNVVGVLYEKRQPSRKNNKLVVENIRKKNLGNMQEIFEENFDEFAPMVEEVIITDNKGIDYKVEIETNVPKFTKVKEKSTKIKTKNTNKEIEDSNMKRKARKIRRGSFRFKADVV